jgi:hypothetical protein
VIDEAGAVSVQWAGGRDDKGKYDVAVMDDFIYGEPQAVT